MRKKMTVAIIFAAMLLLSSSFAVAGNALAQKYDITMNLFSARYVTVEMSKSVPASYGNGDSRRGMLLTASGSSSWAEFKPNFSGKFELDYRVFEETQGLKKYSVSFLDINSAESFSVNAEVSKGNISYIVSANGKSFSVEGKDKPLIVGSALSHSLSFDANSLELKVNGKLLWDFSHESIVGFTLGGFQQYNVKLSFTDCPNSGKILLYTLNGQSLSAKALFPDNAAPEIYAPIKAHGTKDTAFLLPKPYVYDVVDGIIAEENVDYEIYIGSLLVESGDYEDGKFFAPPSADEYTLIYKVLDKALNEKVFEQNFTVFEERPNLSFKFGSILEGGQIGAGSKLYIPKVTAQSELSRNRDIRVTVDIYLDGEPIDGYTGLYASGFDFTFSQTGKYSVSFSAFSGELTENETIIFDVKDDLAVLTLSSDLQNSVSIGEKYVFPQGTLTFEGQSKPAQTLVEFPLGALYRSSFAEISEYGYYTITYFAEFNDVVHSVKRKFKGAHAAPAVVQSNVDVETKIAEYSSGGDSVSGLLVLERSSSKVDFAEPISLRGKKKGDTFIELTAWPFAAPERDYNGLLITLTDTKDKTNKVEISITMTSTSAGGTSYIKASHSGLPMVGINAAGSVYSGTASNGYLIYHSFYGIHSVKSVKESTIKLSMDYETKRIYAENPAAAGSNETVCNLVNTGLFAKAWQGFSNDECYISVESQVRKATQTRYLITNIGGFDMSKAAKEDYDAALRVNYGDYTKETIPEGIANKPYKLFKAECYNDLYEELPVKTNIYYGYGTANQYELDIKNDSFTPNLKGEYTVVYKAVDGFGKEYKELVPVNVTGDESFTLQELNAQKTGVASEAVPIAEFIPSGNKGNIETEITVKKGSESVDVKDGYFIPDSARSYTVNCFATDYLGRTAEKSYSVAVSANPVPVFDNEPALPPVFTAGREYNLPIVTAKAYDGESPAPLSVQVSVKYGSGDEIILEANEKFIPPAETPHGTKLTFIYRAIVGGIPHEGSKIVKESVAASYNTTSGSINIADYFVTDNVTAVASSTYVTLSVADNGTPDASFMYPKTLLADSFALRFNMNSADINNFGSLKFTLFDSAETNVYVTLEIKKSGKQSDLYVNGVLSSKMEGSFWGKDGTNGSNYDFQIYFNNKDCTVKDAAGNVVATIIKDARGRAFNGFNSGKLYLSGEFLDVTDSGGSAINLYNLNGQSINNESADKQPPLIVAQKEYGGILKIGSTGLIPSAIADDILSFANDVKVSVYMPDNVSFATAEDGTVLNNADASKEYYVKYTSHGKYSISYSTTDKNGNIASDIAKVVYVMGEDTPEFSLSAAAPESGAVNSKISVPNVIAASNLKYYVIVRDPNNQSILFFSSEAKVLEELAFTPTMKGEYLLRYYVYDQYHNFVIEDYKITVA